MILEVLLTAAATWSTPAHIKIVEVESHNRQLVCHVTTNPDAGNIREYDWTRPGSLLIQATYTPAMHQFLNYTSARMEVEYRREVKR